ncbi:hypothetical protein [Nitrospina watsonii]|uniref:Uncharacterized protein n=1 Tax=Nitrospina watsonii TaxID=1323948 RepID=A0ABM9HGA7_9BACT|nr:hypothetical protein [Nitrospina watsonii]CAI2719361.1 conserved exported protein of unknown function [Nitrospina watsonii]
MKKIAYLFLIAIVSMLFSLSSTVFAYVSSDTGNVLVLSDDQQKEDDDQDDDDDDKEKPE